jgi:hypothetical protein
MNTNLKVIVVYVLFLSWLASGCAPEQIFEPTITPMPTSTSTLIPTATNTPGREPTATQTEVSMPMEDWNVVFDGSFKGDNGATSELSWVLDPKRYKPITDPDAVRALSPETDIFVLDSSTHEITIHSYLEPAANTLVTGGIVLEPQHPRNAVTFSHFAIEAAKQARLRGDKISVVFGESSAESDLVVINLDTTLDQNGKTVLKMPKHFRVSYKDQPGSLSLEEAGVTGVTEDNWFEKITEAGFTAIDISPQ